MCPDPGPVLGQSSPVQGNSGFWVSPQVFLILYHIHTVMNFPTLIPTATIDFSNTLETLGTDTVISHQAMKRVWPATARDTCFASHIRKLDLSEKGMKDAGATIVVNFSVDHPDAVRYLGRLDVYGYVNDKWNASIALHIYPPSFHLYLTDVHTLLI